MQSNYHPSKMVVSAAGKIDHNEFVDIADNFNTIWFSDSLYKLLFSFLLSPIYLLLISLMSGDIDPPDIIIFIASSEVISVSITLSTGIYNINPEVGLGVVGK